MKICNGICRYKRQHYSPEKTHIRNIKRLYNLSREQYIKMLEDQNYVCKICKKVCNTGMRLSVDHCHVTGKVRGLLCRECNSCLGKAKDDVELLEKMIKYLKLEDII